jgi:hypothetical protein
MLQQQQQQPIKIGDLVYCARLQLTARVLRVRRAYYAQQPKIVDLELNTCAMCTKLGTQHAVLVSITEVDLVQSA